MRGLRVRVARSHLSKLMKISIRARTWRTIFKIILCLTIAIACFRLIAPATATLDPAQFLITQKGNLPIVISAPHGGRNPIPGIPERQAVKGRKNVTVRDENTAELAQKLAAFLEQKLGNKVYLTVAQFERKYVDANRSPDTAYDSEKAKPYYDAYHQNLRDACLEVQKQWGHGLLLDLHGQGASRRVIFRGTKNGLTVSSLRDRFGQSAIVGANSILGQLEKKGYQVFPANNSPQQPEDARFNGGYIVQNYGGKEGTGIDAIQLELGTQQRAKTQLDRTASDLAEAIEVFAREYLPQSKL